MPPGLQKAETITAKRPGRYKQPNAWRFLLTQTQPNPPDSLSKVLTRLAVSLWNSRKRTLRLMQFCRTPGGTIPKELTFRRVENGEIDKQYLGSIKLTGCCQQAQKDGLGYAWIDTCCIDKTNLVELSEAINSMYRWYSRASVCYAYLSDVPDDDDPPRLGSKFRSSRWFQRGWTLQELLAPKHLRFYNSEWRSIGTKGTICAVIKNITRVPQQFLLGITSLHGASVAQRMSWAAQRQTKRAEDIAYCLLGIFNVTMPMIYGEGGEQAFFRLQEQIMKTTRDDSILAWGLSDEISKPSMNENSQIVARNHTSSPLHSLDVFGGSVRVHMPLLTTAGGKTYGLLSCGPGSNREQVVGIPLARINSGASNEYIRPMGCPSVLQPTTAAGSPPELVHIKRACQRDASATTNQQYWLYEADLFARVNLALVDVEPPSCWDEQMNLISAVRSNDDAADRILLRFRHAEAGSRDFVMILEITPASNTDPQFHMVTCSRDTPLLELVEGRRHITSKVTGKTSASNGTLHLQMRLEPVEEGLISIIPQPMDTPPDVTIDVSAELERSNFVTQFTQLLRDRKHEKEKEVELHAKSKYHGNRLQLAKREREAVDDRIKKLEEERRRLVEAVLMSKYGTPLIAACSRGDVDIVRQLLACSEVEIDRKDSKYGRTALGWASANGHEAVVQLLLDTDKVDVNSTDGNGWSPLRWASERNHYRILLLLVKKGARLDCQLTLQGHTDVVSSVAFSHDSKLVNPFEPLKELRARSDAADERKARLKRSSGARWLPRGA
ncbi:hypothetical protein CCMA1212_010730 [Trichoderma ghanense]|uniref:Heterokaryon incompatibility domain-containing protein n=1 Tax=Trichoderma ghanense TaxID=65468 RepID=A0ABY2GNX2_9HYPO